MDPLEIAQVEFIVHRAENIPLESSDTAYVFLSFGVGNVWFRTDVLQNRSPAWNQKQTFTIRNVNVPLRILLNSQLSPDGGRVKAIGWLKLEISSAAASADTSDRRIVPIISCSRERDSASFCGTLTYELYATNHRQCTNSVSSRCKKFKERLIDVVWNSFSPSMMSDLPKKLLSTFLCQGTAATSTDAPTVQHYPGAQSPSAQHRNTALETLMGQALQDTFHLSANVARQQPLLKRSLSISFTPSNDEKDDVLPELKQSSLKRQMLKERRKSRVPGSFPIVTRIEPNSGNIFGGTRVAIGGTNLGIDAQDLIGIYICGSNCTSSLEYESDECVYCTTKAWRVCIGDVSVITASGGRSQGNVKFTFHANEKKTSANLKERRVAGISLHLNEEEQRTANGQAKCGTESDDERNPFKESLTSLHMLEKQYRRVLRTVDDGTQTEDVVAVTPPKKHSLGSELECDRRKQLEMQNQALKDENEHLKCYVDKLVARVLEEAPNALFLEPLMESH